VTALPAGFAPDELEWGAPHALIPPDDDGRTPLPPSFRAIALEVYRQAEAVGDDDWRRAAPEEKAAAIAGTVLTVARGAAQLEARGYTGPDAMARYLADQKALNDPERDGDPAAIVPLRGTRPARPTPTNGRAHDLDALEDGTPAATWRTLADVSDDPPRPLLFGMLEPDGPTLACAAPGTGKGMSGAWLICEAQRAGMLPLIFDAERRPREWARRVSGLGGDRSRVVYIEPEDLGPKLAGQPLWVSAPTIGQVGRAAGADLYIVDSIMPASGVGEERLRSDAQVPYLWVAALDALARPSLSFGHPPKGQPEGEPFGSFAWVAAMRLTWQGTRAEGERHAIRWRPKKRNERGHIPGILLTFAYGDDGRPCSVVRADDEESTRDWILAALVGGPRTVGELAEDLLAEIPDPGAGEVDRIRERLGQALRRMAREGWVSKSGTYGKGVRWGLRLTR
jgi:hypothetical protein